LNIRSAELIFQPLLGNSFTTLADAEALKIYAVGSFLSADFLDKRNSGDRAIIAGMGAGYADLPVQQSFGFGRKFPVWIKNDIRLPLPKFVPETGKNYRILFVRGPLTARLLGLNTQDRFADAGYLLMNTDCIQRYKELRKSHISFMPHYTAASDSPGLRKIFEDVGFQYIDPRGDIDEVLKAISSSSLLLTEALHGAVMSDVLRTPWIPMKSSEDIFEFKWIDFMDSIGKAYTPAELKLSWKRSYYSGRNPVSLIKNLTTRVRGAVTRMLISPRETAFTLMKASTLPPVLSSDASIVVIDSLISEKIDEFKESIKNATLFS
jgi:succinoglycan biosynthesis protein ExoV